MKKYAISLVILTVVALPGLLSAESACFMDAQTGNQNVLIVSGGQALTQIQADCALELIDFMAAAVRGVDLIQVDDPMRQIWRTYLVNLYPRLPAGDREFLANAPSVFYNVNVMWPQLTPAGQNSCRQAWGAAMPQVLQFIQPVVTAARQQQSWQTANSAGYGTSYGAGHGSNYGSGASQTADPAAEYRRQQQMANSLAVHNYQMSINTIDLMHSMNQMGGH